LRSAFTPRTAELAGGVGLNLDQQLIMGQRRFKQTDDNSSIGMVRTFNCTGYDLRIVGRHHRRVIDGRIGVRKIAADGARDYRTSGSQSADAASWAADGSERSPPMSRYARG